MSDLVPSDFTPRSSEKRASESTQRRREARSTSHSPSRDSRRSKDRRRDRSRSRDHRSRRRRSRSRPRHRDDRYRQRRRSRSRSHSRDRSRDRDRRRNGIGGGGRRDRRRGGDARVAPASHPDQDELDQLERTSRTVQVYNLNLRAEERELFQFFSQAGPLVDIKIIRDLVLFFSILVAPPASPAEPPAASGGKASGGKGAVDMFGNHVQGTAMDLITCPLCDRPKAAGKFAVHLEKCMGRGRQASRAAARRMSETAAYM